jgi:hypothetical protein
MYRKSEHPQPRSNRRGPGVPYRSTAPAITSGLRSFWEGRKQRRSGCVLITATMSIRSSSGLLMMIVLIDLAKRSQQDRSWRRASIEYEKTEPQHVDSAMPSVSRSPKGFSYLPATCTVRCSSPSLAANTDSCIREYSAFDVRDHQAAGSDPNSRRRLSHLPVLTVELPV